MPNEDSSPAHFLAVGITCFSEFSVFIHHLSFVSFWTYKQPARYRINDIVILFTLISSAAFAENSIKASILDCDDDNKFPI